MTDEAPSRISLRRLLVNSAASSGAIETARAGRIRIDYKRLGQSGILPGCSPPKIKDDLYSGTFSISTHYWYSKVGHSLRDDVQRDFLLSGSPRCRPPRNILTSCLHFGLPLAWPGLPVGCPSERLLARSRRRQRRRLFLAS